MSRLEYKFSLCLWDYLTNVLDKREYSRFSLQHSSIIGLIHGAASEAFYLGKQMKTKYLLTKLLQEDSTEFWQEIDLWLRQFYKIKT